MIWRELLWAVPFALLLLSIAVLPLAANRWWERHYPAVSFGLGALVIARYAGISGGPGVLLQTTFEYISFIALIGSLFVVSGGIHINVKGEATPFANCLFLIIGALLANILGTTGASAILIRPWIRMNRYRITAFHIVFFIFIVSNIGGALTPIGDPPLFLGYLKGVPFFWIAQAVWPMWLAALTCLLTVFYCMDLLNFKRAPRQIRDKETVSETWQFSGWKVNVPLLTVILCAVFVQQPFLLRESLMIACATASYFWTPKTVHQKNDFGLAPIKEVAILFAGIFATMIPALLWLEHHANMLGLQSISQFYWASGVLSAVLDNAPTYLNFLSALCGLFFHHELFDGITRCWAVGQTMTWTLPLEAVRTAEFLRNYWPGTNLSADPARALDYAKTAWVASNNPGHLKAISVGAVFFGAMTYIGNGPNFLVKSIAERSKVKTPTFFGYVLCFSIPILLPVLTLIWWAFFR